MNWEQLFNANNLSTLALPVGIGILVAVIMYFFRLALYKYIHKLAAKTTTCFDDIMVRDTRLASLLWCISLGIFVGWKIADTPPAWVDTENKIIPAIFVAIGIYTAIVIIMATLKWYKAEICPRTSSSLDDIIMGTLIFGTPIAGGILGVIAILNVLGMDDKDVSGPLGVILTAINSWMADHFATLAFLVMVAVTALLLTVLIVPKLVNTAVRNSRAEQTEEELKKRSETLISVVGTTIQVLIIFIFILMVIGQMVSWTALAPILTATGVVSVALGFGAQSLVKDVIAGLFIIMENQYRIGDVIKIAGESGVVEEINLRRTILRDGNGVYHVIPNGQISVSSNLTKQWSRVNLNISVSYDTDLDKAIAIINRVGKEMAEDPIWMQYINSAPIALRVDNLGDSGIDIKIMGETKPSRQWEVAGELRLRLKKAFDKEGIEIPFPHTKVIFGNQPSQVWPKETEIIIDDKSQTKKLPN